MGKKMLDLVGQRFGRLIVVKFAYTKNGRSYWFCNCDCGNEIVVGGSDLKCKNTQSCGCIHKEVVSNTAKLNKKYNTYDLTGEYGIGYTSKDEEFYFDLEDYDKIKDYCWHKDKNDYVISHIANSKKCIKMHRLIFSHTNDFIDHINHCVYDNRKSNLRIVTHSQNMRNHKIHINNSSGVSGVSWHKKANKWWAYINVDGKRINLGYFDKFEDAVKARKNAEEKYFGEFSYDNSQKQV